MSNLFSRAAPPAPAAPLPPPTMPDPMSPASLEARRKAQQAATEGGRTSTVLSTAASRGASTIAGASAKLGAS